MQHTSKLDKIILMRIGVFDPYLDDLGGGEKYMMTIAECLSKNHQVEIFWNEKNDLDALLQRFSLDLSRVKVVRNIFEPNFSKIKRITESKKYDVIIILSDGSIPFVLSKKLFIHVQQPLGRINQQKLIARIKSSRVNTLFYNSKYTRSFNQKNFKTRSLVIYPPVTIFSKKTKKENIILTVGRFRVKDVVTKTDDYKKLPVMIQAFKELVKNGLNNWKLTLAVSIQEKDKSAFEEIEKSAKDFPIDFLINKSNDELWEIYSRAKIYWHASGFGEDLVKHPEFAEHFGISTVEAMGAGAVPVVINAGGQKEIVENNINGFLWNNLNELKEKTLELTRNESLLNKISIKASKSSLKFSKERFCKEINELILS